MKHYLDLSAIKCVIYDFDGVFTTNSVFVDQFGREFVECSRYDGFGLEILASKFITQIVLSTESVPIASARMAKLGIPAFTGISDKRLFGLKWCHQENVLLSECAFLGNDINDIGLMIEVGFPFCPIDAHSSVLNIASVLSKPGGRGVVRELCDLINEQVTSGKNELHLP